MRSIPIAIDRHETFVVQAEKIAVRASQITGPERDELYARQAERRPVFGTYPGKTSRVIPVIVLERVR